MWHKVVVAAAAAASVTSAHVPDMNATQALNLTASESDVLFPAAEVFPYGRELFKKFLNELNMHHVEGHPLSTLEYNEAVDGVEDLIEGRWSFNHAFNAKVKHGVLKLMSRMSPEELEQLLTMSRMT
ncbi:hypothetical protein H310_07721 [Aphanomyces invadans]|nr:hypothetical protein H310_07721 [Aphanomyces invadans]ETV99652.1 hypothetical protein H310_07721 [Aphanomyces invadans]|eukprot:XP_008871428.1 hypothetical protein H310_07721 [Aphanomyces invadans]